MEKVKVSPKYQVVIPKTIRKILGIKPGMIVQVLHRRNSIEYIPEKKMNSMRGFLKGITTDVDRETDRL